MNLFPMIQPRSAQRAAELPIPVEVKWDYKTDTPVWRYGLPVTVTGAEAVLVWAWKALHVPRYRYEIYTWDYGNECEALIGQQYTDELKRAEAIRYVKECLLVNPYIEDVGDIEVEFADGLLSIRCRLTTIYGEVTVDV